MELEEFSKIEMEVPSCSLSVIQGSSFSLDYNLSSAYEITEMGVKNGTLVFKCEHRFPAAMFHWDWKQNYVRVTFPAGKRFEQVRLYNISGPLEAADINTAQLELKTVSGKMTVSGSTAELFCAKTTSGALQLTGCGAGQLECGTVSGSLTASEVTAANGCRMHTTSGAVRLDGELHGNLEFKSTSGSIHANGKLEGSIDVRTTSGGVEMNLDGRAEEYSYSLHTVSGGRKVNGQNANASMRKDAPNMITMHAVSGGLRLNFAG